MSRPTIGKSIRRGKIVLRCDMDDDKGYIIDLKKQKTCKHRKTVVADYDTVWRDGNIRCVECGKIIRSFDAG